MNPELYEEELAALRAERNELRERLAASEAHSASLRDLANIAAEQSKDFAQSERDFRARAEAEFERLRAEINAIRLMHPGTIAEITAMTDAAKKRLMGGGA